MFETRILSICQHSQKPGRASSGTHNCAADSPFRPFEQMSYEKWREIVDISRGRVPHHSATLSLMKTADCG